MNLIDAGARSPEALSREHRSVLVVDDDPGICDLLESVLELAGYHARRASDAGEAMTTATRHRIDLALIDIGLAGVDGRVLLPHLRRQDPTTGLILLTARSDIESKVDALRGGADDYITKPFHPTEVIARVDAVLRRTKGEEPSELGYADLTVDIDRLTVRRAQRKLALTPTELRLLVFLLRNAERVVSRSQILDQVWQYEFPGEGLIVEKVISNLRRKVDTGSEPLIHTVRGFGYTLRRADRDT
ncbi:response regulator transcription factor [Mycolicibacterium sp. D5.8-2]|uniref:response regulator transcription factor n=1 Tax=Mycolicibacterium sp. D5.8-2 TaxID=3085903 RepID=UPI00298C70A6|nr:response regulator transcription factor [Mycolicibacterium sp. D5.8-2]MDW5613186.1 response regulator transcription factor [Mycolicibacterium sp. D5.8-2]